MFKIYYGIILVHSFKSTSLKKALIRAQQFRVMKTHLITPGGKEISLL